MSGEFVAFVVVIVFVASAMLLRRQRSRITVGDEQGLPPELHGAEIAFAERTFRSQRRQFVARLGRAYRTAGGLHLVELKTRERDAVYISDVIELSVQRIAVEDEAGEPVSGDAWAMAVKDTKLVLPDDFYEQELEQVILRMASRRWRSTAQPAVSGDRACSAVRSAMPCGPCSRSTAASSLRAS